MCAVPFLFAGMSACERALLPARAASV